MTEDDGSSTLPGTVLEEERRRRRDEKVILDRILKALEEKERLRDIKWRRRPR